MLPPDMSLWSEKEQKKSVYGITLLYAKVIYNGNSVDLFF